MKPLPMLLALVVFAVFVTTVLYGCVRYPDPPYRQHGDTYTDKMGRPRTLEEVQGLRRWEHVLYVTGTAWAVVCIGGTIQHYLRTGSLRRDARPRRSSASSPAV